MGFYIPSATSFGKGRSDDDDEESKPSLKAVGKSSKDGFYMPNATNYQKVYERQEEERKEREQEAADKKKAEQKKLDEAKRAEVPKSIARNIGDFTAAVNEKVLGGAAKAAVKSVNMVASGFNSEEAEKRTSNFLKTTKQTNNKGEAALASGEGVNRNSTAFQTGQASGDVIKTLVGVDAPAEVYKSAKNLYQQAKMSTDIGNAGSVIGQKEADKLRKFIDEDEKAGKLTKPQADAKRAKLQTEADKTKKAVAETEKKTGAKVDQTSGVVSLVETAANLTGLGQIGKAVFKKTVEVAEKRLGRNLTEVETKNLAEQTKQAVPEPETPQLDVVPEKLEVKPMEVAKVDPLDDVLTTSPEPKVEAPTIPKPETTPPVDMEGTLFNAAKVKAEERLGRTLNPQEVENLSTSTKQLVAEKVPAAPDAQLTSPELPTGETGTVAIKELSPPKVEGDTVSGNAARIEQVALEKKLTEKMGDLPQYKAINMKEQADEAVNLVSMDRQKAIDIIEGKTNPPGNLKAQSVHQALEDIAVREADGELLTKLAKSNVNTELSESAQNLRIAAERDPHSAVEQIRQVRDARIKAAVKRAKTSVAKEKQAIQAKVKASTPPVKKETWASFVKGLEC